MGCCQNNINPLRNLVCKMGPPRQLELSGFARDGSFLVGGPKVQSTGWIVRYSIVPLRPLPSAVNRGALWGTIPLPFDLTDRRG